MRVEVLVCLVFLSLCSIRCEASSVAEKFGAKRIEDRTSFLSADGAQAAVLRNEDKENLGETFQEAKDTLEIILERVNAGALSGKQGDELLAKIKDVMDESNSAQENLSRILELLAGLESSQHQRSHRIIALISRGEAFSVMGLSRSDDGVYVDTLEKVIGSLRGRMKNVGPQQSFEEPELDSEKMLKETLRSFFACGNKPWSECIHDWIDDINCGPGGCVTTTTTSSTTYTTTRKTTTTTTTTVTTTTVTTTTTTVTTTTSTTLQALTEQDFAKGRFTGTQTWQTIAIASFVPDPVVIISVLDTLPSSLSAEIQIRNVTPLSFDVRIFIAPCHNIPGPITSALSYIALTQGVYKIGNLFSRTLVVGLHNMVNIGQDTITFPTIFAGTPAVVTMQQTRPVDQTSHTRHIQVTSSSLTFLLEQENNLGIAPWSRPVGYVAVEQSSDEQWLPGMVYKALRTPSLYDHFVRVFDYSDLNLADPPCNFASPSYHGTDSIVLGQAGASALGVFFFVHEDAGPLCVSDVFHAPEVLDVLIIGTL